LTAEAVLGLSEEALVLYVKALALLAKSLSVANAWWVRHQRRVVSGGGGGGGSLGSSPQPLRSETQVASNRINSAVQWMRARFNEVLEKAEFSRAKLIDAQKQLPDDDPRHPSNHNDISSRTDSGVAGGMSGVSSSPHQTNSGRGEAVDGVILSEGLTAERLMYERAIEMSKSAAINELAGVDLKGCEVSYVTALRMLEAVVERDEEMDSTAGRGGAGQGRGGGAEGDEDDGSAVDGDDREAVVKRKLPSQHHLPDL
jgi:serine/threonine-protein kinase ULK/ATG1